MIDASFVPNINYVTRTIQTTRDLVDTIEDDIKDIRSLMSHRVNQFVDNETLIQLLKIENIQLKDDLVKAEEDKGDLLIQIESQRQQFQSEVDDMENQIAELTEQNQQIISESDEKSEKILLYEAEIERILKQCNNAIKEKTEIITKAKELDEYCNQIEKQLEITTEEYEKTVTEKQQLHKEKNYLEEMLQESNQQLSEEKYQQQQKELMIQQLQYNNQQFELEIQRLQDLLKKSQQTQQSQEQQMRKQQKQFHSLQQLFQQEKLEKEILVQKIQDLQNQLSQKMEKKHIPDRADEQSEEIPTIPYNSLDHQHQSFIVEREEGKNIESKEYLINSSSPSQLPIVQRTLSNNPFDDFDHLFPEDSTTTTSNNIQVDSSSLSRQPSFPFLNNQQLQQQPTEESKFSISPSKQQSPTNGYFEDNFDVHEYYDEEGEEAEKEQISNINQDATDIDGNEVDGEDNYSQEEFERFNTNDDLDFNPPRTNEYDNEDQIDEVEEEDDAYIRTIEEHLPDIDDDHEEQPVDQSQTIHQHLQGNDRNNQEYYETEETLNEHKRIGKNVHWSQHFEIEEYHVQGSGNENLFLEDFDEDNIQLSDIMNFRVN